MCNEETSGIGHSNILNQIGGICVLAKHIPKQIAKICVWQHFELNSGVVNCGWWVWRHFQHLSKLIGGICQFSNISNQILVWSVSVGEFGGISNIFRSKLVKFVSLAKFQTKFWFGQLRLVSLEAFSTSFQENWWNLSVCQNFKPNSGSASFA